MPPKFKFTREQIVAAALEVTRKNGITGLTARGLAAELGSSAKPIFGLFQNMEEVQREVVSAANRKKCTCRGFPHLCRKTCSLRLFIRSPGWNMRR